MIENASVETEWVITEDEYGIYKKRVNEFGIEEALTEYKQKWYDENPPVEPTLPEPTETEILTDYIIDVDYRVTMIELGL